MTRADELIRLLRRALTESDTVGLIKRFQSAVWDERGDFGDAGAAKILRNLAYDLDYYEPEQMARREDPSFFGRERAISLIQTALKKLDRV